MRLEPVRTAIAAALLGAVLSACVVAPGPEYGVAVGYAPPAPQYEVIGVAPAPGYFSIGGGWFWEGGRYAWHPGYWAEPRPGYRWVPRTWVRGRDGWHERGGGWVRR